LVLDSFSSATRLWQALSGLCPNRNVSGVFEDYIRNAILLLPPAGFNVVDPNLRDANLPFHLRLTFTLQRNKMLNGCQRTLGDPLHRIICTIDYWSHD
jgi:hypothetical protein